MKRNCFKSYVSLIMAVLMILSAFTLAGCGEKSVGDESQSSGVITDVTTPKETTEAGPPVFTIAGKDISEYKLVYYDTVYAKACAQELQAQITKLTGKIVPIRKHTAKQSEYEILLGKTGRDESNAVRSGYDRPNVYYDIKLSGTKLVIMGEGYTVLNKVTDLFAEYLNSLGGGEHSLDSFTLSGNIKSEVDTLQKSMAERAEGTDLRVFHWNFAAPYLNSASETNKLPYSSNVTRGEVMADIILQLYPDIITTNEFYASHNGNTELFGAVMGELGEYYTCLDSKYDKDKPIAGADVIKDKTINSNIIYRNDAGLSVVDSSWRYSTEKTTVSSANPYGLVYYHGSHTAVFSQNGKKFIVSVSHYADSRSDNKWAKEHLAAIADAQAANGGNLPVILTGDLYTGYTSSSANSGYKYLVSQGYIDSQRTALVNANNNISHGTFHNIGERQTTRISEDFVWHTSEMQALAFKVLTSKDIDDTSDHYPVMADIKFK